jgi:hypothetical protein
VYVVVKENSVRRGRGRGNGRGRMQDGQGEKQRDFNAFRGQCYECKPLGHKCDNCPRVKSSNSGDVFVFSASSDLDHQTIWLLDGDASSHMLDDRNGIEEYRELVSPVCFLLDRGATVKLTDELFMPQLDSKLVSVLALTAREVMD